MIRLPGNIKKIMGETYDQRLTKPIAAVRLPCAENHKWKEPQYVEIYEPRDQKIKCPMCGKEHYLVWQSASGHKFS